VNGASGSPGGEVVAVRVPDLLDGVRLDRAVSLLTGRSRAAAAALVAAGAVELDGAPCRGRATPLVAGSALRIELDDAASGGVRPDDAVSVEVVYVDDELIVVDKPAGMVVHPGAGQREGTLVAGLLARFPELAELVEQGVSDAERPGIVQRLDKDTSGLLVVARTASALAGLRAQLADHSLQRGYAAVVDGEVAADRGLIDAPIGRSERRPTAMTVSSGGRPARTRYRVLARFGDGHHPHSLLALALETGRTHQIRVHLAAIGHPILGDLRYGGAEPADGSGAGRPWLHAYRLGLVHPATGRSHAWRSPLPAELAASLERLGATPATLPDEP
jgi:23S rRNA pseudouridine1911/1915/1917 synthase